MSEANKVRSRRVFEEIISQGSLEAIDEVFAADFVNQPFGATGRAGVKQLAATFRTILPDVQATVEEQIAEGDTVVSRVTYRGTHEGPTGPLFGDIPATGKPVVMSGIYIHRHVHGQIAEGYTVVDFLTMLRQIGAVVL